MFSTATWEFPEFLENYLVPPVLASTHLIDDGIVMD